MLGLVGGKNVSALAGATADQSRAVRTAALLVPAWPDRLRLDDVEQALARRKIRRAPQAATRRHFDARKWTKTIYVADGELEMEVVHNPDSSEFVFLPSHGGNVPVLRKPFTLAELAAVVEENVAR